MHTTSSRATNDRIILINWRNEYTGPRRGGAIGCTGRPIHMMSFVSVLTACVAKRYLIAPWISQRLHSQADWSFDASLMTQNLDSLANHRSCAWRTKYQRARSDVYSRNVICSARSMRTQPWDLKGTMVVIMLLTSRWNDSILSHCKTATTARNVKNFSRNDTE